MSDDLQSKMCWHHLFLVKNTKWSRIIATYFLTGSSFQLGTANQKHLVQASFSALFLTVLKQNVLIKKQMVSTWQFVRA